MQYSRKCMKPQRLKVYGDEKYMEKCGIYEQKFDENVVAMSTGMVIT